MLRGPQRQMSDENTAGSPLAALSLQRVPSAPVPVTGLIGTRFRGRHREPGPHRERRAGRRPGASSAGFYASLVGVPGRSLSPAFRPTAPAAGPASGRDTPYCGGFFSKSCGRSSESGTTGEAVLRRTCERDGPSRFAAPAA